MVLLCPFQPKMSFKNCPEIKIIHFPSDSFFLSMFPISEEQVKFSFLLLAVMNRAVSVLCWLNIGVLHDVLLIIVITRIEIPGSCFVYFVTVDIIVIIKLK